MFNILTRISKNVDKCIDKFCDTLFFVTNEPENLQDYSCPKEVSST